jgi:hypothetical protein
LWSDRPPNRPPQYSTHNDVSTYQFCELLCGLDIDLADGKKLNIFIETDKSGDGFLTEDEFVDTWDAIQNQLVQAAMEEMGLSPTRIVMALVGVAILLFMLFLFIFVGMAALVGGGGTGSMGAMVNSMATGGGSGASTGGGDDNQDPEEAGADAMAAFEG